MKEIVRKVLPLSLIVALRFFGLFIVLSVLSQYAMGMPGGTAMLAGMAVGGYALTQAVLQVPYGVLSDRIGRKKTLLIGLLIFAAGSAVCALSNHIYVLLAGRFLQGAGAIGSVVTAMIADHVREDQRAHAMAVMGMTIALSFAAAMVIGPIVGGLYSVSALFWLTGILAVGALVILFGAVPEPPSIVHSYSQEEARIKHVFGDKDLVRMYITFLFHSSTMAIAFFLIPIVLKQHFGLGAEHYWQVYLPAVFFGIVAMGPSAVFGEKYNKGKEVFLVSIAFVAASFALMGWADSLFWFGVGASFFFIGFNMFEPLLQSFVSKFAKVHQKGAALGVANTFAYVGIFLGGAIGGYVYEHFGRGGVAILVLGVTVIWAVWIIGMRSPGLRDNLFLEYSHYDPDKIDALKGLEGVTDFYLNETEELIIVKFDNDRIDGDTIRGALLRR